MSCPIRWLPLVVLSLLVGDLAFWAGCGGSNGGDAATWAPDSAAGDGGATASGGVVGQDGGGMAGTGGALAATGGTIPPVHGGGGSVGTGGSVGAGGALDGSVPGSGGSGAPTCGQPGMPCCDDKGCNGDGCCVSGICMAAGGTCVGLGGGICNAGACGACGGAGMPCCGAGVCTAPATTCNAGTCAKCGDLGLPCCAGSGSGNCHAPNTICASNVCQACGTPGIACCPGNHCTAPGCCYANVCAAETAACGMSAGTCQAGRCSGCGAANQPCCSGSSCYDGLLCRSGNCTFCGGAGQPCCGGTDSATSCQAGMVCVGSASEGVCARCGAPGDVCCGSGACADGCCTNGRCVAAASCPANPDAGSPPDVPLGGAGGAGGAGGTTTQTGGAGGGGTGGSSIDPSAYDDVDLIADCSGPRNLLYGAWFSVAGPSSSIVPADSSGSFPMSADGYVGKAAHVTGTVAAGDYAQLGMNMLLGSDLYDASAYDGISFWAKSPAPLIVEVKIAQKNNDPSYGVCETGITCYKYPHTPIAVGTTWTRYVVPFASMVSDPLPDGGLVPVTPEAVKHFQFSMPVGVFDFWIDEVYFVRAK